MFKRSALRDDQVRVVFYNDLYRAYRSDGLYEREVLVSRTIDTLFRFAKENNWRVIFGNASR